MLGEAVGEALGNNVGAPDGEALGVAEGASEAWVTETSRRKSNMDFIVGWS